MGFSKDIGDDGVFVERVCCTYSQEDYREGVYKFFIRGSLTQPWLNHFEAAAADDAASHSREARANMQNWPGGHRQPQGNS